MNVLLRFILVAIGGLAVGEFFYVLGGLSAGEPVRGAGGKGGSGAGCSELWTIGWSLLSGASMLVGWHVRMPFGKIVQ